jgi:hypothetical protein
MAKSSLLLSIVQNKSYSQTCCTKIELKAVCVLLAAPPVTRLLQHFVPLRDTCSVASGEAASPDEVHAVSSISLCNR